MHSSKQVSFQQLFGQFRYVQTYTIPTYKNKLVKAMIVAISTINTVL